VRSAGWHPGNPEFEPCYWFAISIFAEWNVWHVEQLLATPPFGLWHSTQLVFDGNNTSAVSRLCGASWH